MNFAVLIKGNKIHGVAVMKPYPMNAMPAFVLYKGEVFLFDENVGQRLFEAEAVKRHMASDEFGDAKVFCGEGDSFVAYEWQMGAQAQQDQRLPTGWCV